MGVHFAEILYREGHADYRFPYLEEGWAEVLYSAPQTVLASPTKDCNEKVLDVGSGDHIPQYCTTFYESKRGPIDPHAFCWVCDNIL